MLVTMSRFLSGAQCRILLYLTYWFPAPERARVVGLFMVALPLSGLIGSPLSGELMRVNGLGLEGWQWMLILEGLPAVAARPRLPVVICPTGQRTRRGSRPTSASGSATTLAAERSAVAGQGHTDACALR